MLISSIHFSCRSSHISKSSTFDVDTFKLMRTTIGTFEFMLISEKYFAKMYSKEIPWWESYMRTKSTGDDDYSSHQTIIHKHEFSQCLSWCLWYLRTRSSSNLELGQNSMFISWSINNSTYLVSCKLWEYNKWIRYTQ